MLRLIPSAPLACTFLMLLTPFLVGTQLLAFRAPLGQRPHSTQPTRTTTVHELSESLPHVKDLSRRLRVRGTMTQTVSRWPDTAGILVLNPWPTERSS